MTINDTKRQLDNNTEEKKITGDTFTIKIVTVLYFQLRKALKRLTLVGNHRKPEAKNCRIS